MRWLILYLLAFVSFTVIAESDTTSEVPTNLDEAVEVIERIVPNEELLLWAKKDLNEALVAVHFGMGMGVRNSWGLWSGSQLRDHFNSVGLYHPDDMSAVIFKSLWHKLNNQPYDLEADVKHYQEYWERQKALYGR